MQKKVFYGRDSVDYIKKSVYMVNVYQAGELYTAKNKHKLKKKQKKNVGREHNIHHCKMDTQY